MTIKQNTILASACLALGLSATACGGAGGASAGGGGSSDLEVFSWWTSGSESAALQVLIDAYEAETDGKVVNAAVSGGGGANARQALSTRLQGGDPPDSWQMHPDQDMMTAVQDGTVADISDLYEENGWAEVMPETLLDMHGSDGKYYAVTIGAHRANVLWTNPAILEDNGIVWDESTTPDEFMADVQTLNDAGITPLCLGDKDVFAASQLLETLILGRIGADGWRDLNAGDLAFDDDAVRTAVEDYVTLYESANSDHSALTWDQAALMVPEGKCAANMMGDWAYGELVNKGFADGEDFGYAPVPGNGDIFDLVGDSFAKPAEDGPNPEGEDIWLTNAMDPEVQLQFALKKGGVPIRTDVPIDDLPPYQKSAAEAFRASEIVSSLAHFQSAPAEFAQAYADAVTSLNGDGNVDGFLTTMTNAQESLLG